MRSRLLCTLALVAGCAADAGTPPLGNTGLQSLLPNPVVDTADGTRLVTITATVDTTFKSANPVVFSTNIGAFSNGTATATVTPDSTGFARAYLKAPTDSSAGSVMATAGGTSLSIPVEFWPALPEWIAVSAGSAVAKIGSTADVTATPGRGRGKVTPGGFIRFELADPSQKALVRLSVDSIPAAQDQVKTQLTWLSADSGSVRVRISYGRNKKTMDTTSVVATFFKGPAS